MLVRSFEAFATPWTLLIDADNFPSELMYQILAETEQFEQQYSRFIADSEVFSFRNAKPGKYLVSKRLAEMLTAAKKIEELTWGRFNAAVGLLLEEAGYDSDYSFKQAPKDRQLSNKLPKWSVEDRSVILDGGLVFDIGGIGKGYWIDWVSNFLKDHGFEYHLVDGGGDMMATTKNNGDGWQIALEWPGREDFALGKAVLRNQGLAASDIFRRKWKQWHHLIDASKGEPTSSIVASVAIAENCFFADQTTSILSFTEVGKIPELQNKFECQYLALTSAQQLFVSNNWSNELFIKQE